MTSISTLNESTKKCLSHFKTSHLSEEQYKFTVQIVRAILDPWLALHFGERCQDYEYGCENCKRWKLADELLEWYGSDKKQETLEQEIATLEECIKWRKELLANMKENESAK